MFPRRDRLPRVQFETALSTGRRYSSEHFSIVVPKGARGYAVVIPKKVVRLSSTRHRIKRQILAALRGANPPPALVLFIRSSVYGVHYQDIKKELYDLLLKIQ